MSLTNLGITANLKVELAPLTARVVKNSLQQGPICSCRPTQRSPRFCLP